MLDLPDDRLPDHRLQVLTDPALDALFAPVTRVGVDSAWYRHLPFAAWIVQASRPRVLVELGTHAGVSYAAFCEAVQRCRLPTRCFAIDTWKGDEHAGVYDETIYADFRAFHDRRFADFSTLLRMTFDDGSQKLVPGGIDLLHIDGLHTYEAVRHDFETWKPLLSKRAVVLLHDTCERERDFGVWRLWNQLREDYPSFEFLHGHGLGVVAVGEDIPRPVAALCTLSDDNAVAIVRQRFALLGERWQKDAEACLLGSRLGRLEGALAQAAGRERAVRDQLSLVETKARAEAADSTARKHALESQLQVFAARLQASQRRATELEAAMQVRAAQLERTTAELRGSAIRHQTDAVELDTLRRSIAEATRNYETIRTSTLWRAAAPVRAVGSLVPKPARRAVRRLMRRFVASASPLPVPAATPAAPAAAGDRVVFISGEPHTPGHVYRVLRQAEAAARAGWDVGCMTIDEAPARIAEIAAASVVVLWRATWSDTVERIVQTVRDSGIRLVFDLDDLMFRPELATVEVIDGIRSQNFDPQNVAAHFNDTFKVVAVADACSCTTVELARQFREFAKPTFVLPNGFDAATLARSRLAVRARRADPDDELVRIGYASGSRTHQRDFAQAAGAVARLLEERPESRLVLFETPDGLQKLLDVEEFAAIDARPHQIEWRPMVPLDRLPLELARFDINLAPLEVGNPFCEAKSELRVFEAALVDVPTITSPTGPMRRAIRHGETGILAETPEDWYRALTALADDANLRRRIGHAAYLDMMFPYGPERRAERVLAMLRQMQGGEEGMHAFALEVTRAAAPPPVLPETETVLSFDSLGEAEVTVIIPHYNYVQFIVEALDSVQAQTLECLDLIVVDDASTDGGLAIVQEWAEENRTRFNRLVVLRNCANAKLARTRNAGFDAAETPFVLPLDADNRLLPDCCKRMVEIARSTGAGFVYPEIRYFGGADDVIGTEKFTPMRLAGGNFIDAMALVAKSAWAAVGGITHIEGGWEDYDFWCCLAERGFLGVPAGAVLAEYRVHDRSMLRTQTDTTQNKLRVIAQLESRHAWLSIPYRM